MRRVQRAQPRPAGRRTPGPLVRKLRRGLEPCRTGAGEGGRGYTRQAGAATGRRDPDGWPREGRRGGEGRLSIPLLTGPRQTSIQRCTVRKR